MTEKKQAPKKITEAQTCELTDTYQSFILALNEYKNKIPLEIIEDTAKEVGMESSDPKTIKFLAAATDYFITEINESILSLNPIPKNKPQSIQQAEEEKEKGGEKGGKATKGTKDKSQITKNFNVQHLLGALSEKGIRIDKPPYSAHSKIINEAIKNENKSE